MTTGCHPSHETEWRDSSHYEFRCINCGATDVTGCGWGRLAKPCPGRDIEADALRYRHLRTKDLEMVYSGGVFAGRTPENVVLNLEDLDAAIDAEMKPK